MVFLQIAALAFWTFFAYSMGQTPPSGLNAFGTLVSMSFFIALPALYLSPIYVAWKRNHPNLAGVALVNVLLGWTFVGWVASLVWSSTAKEATPTRAAGYEETEYSSVAIAETPTPEPAPVPTPLAQPPALASVADEIIKLGNLRDLGMLTDDEFQQQKKIVLSRA